MKNIIVYKVMAFMMVLTGLLSCEERENYMDGPSTLNIIESASLNSKSAEIDHLAGKIKVSLAGNTDLTSVLFEASVPEGVNLSPSSGSMLDLNEPNEITVSNGDSERVYRISATILPSKIAFLGDGATIAGIVDDDVQAAALWTEETYGDDFVYIPYDGLTDEALEGVNVLVYVHDQVGSSDQPDAVLERLNVLSKFYVQGGKIVAGLLGTGLVEELGRDTSGLRTIIGTGAGGSNPDSWGIGFSGSSLSNIISNGLEFFDANLAYVIDPGYKEDHNALWNLGSFTNAPYATFNSLYNAEPIAIWDHTIEAQTAAGIIVWNPFERFEGYIITIGIGGMEWSMNDDRDNPYLSNVEKIYKNSIDYLSSR
ncbi:DUF4960 domain-containing protein [Flagellimonas amoyensis]|uniref:DUF4960 domain-containing protein n=1 Tax=Flagellimonas amoyensis TaxID=2169401 RepID=UPI000D3532C2|nr:DUF4960 domain-containing protein [Allomuricauda amoyensis]